MADTNEDGNMEEVAIEEQAVETPAKEEEANAKRSCKSRLCDWYQFGGTTTAKGYCTLGVARGALVMSNVFLSTSFIYLASEEAGCLDEEDKVVDDCDARVYGMSPTALVSNIAVFSGLLSAFFMPFSGAIVDYTRHRRTVGIAVATLMILIQGAQIGTVSATWFPMAMLQAISGFLYQMQILATYAYLPDVARTCGQEKTTIYQSIFTMVQFAAQALFLIVIIGVSVGAGFSGNDVLTAQFSQAVNTVWSGLFFIIGWKILPNAPAARVLPEGKKSLFLHSFSQVWTTIKGINTHYKRSLRWYFLTLIFAEAATNAFTVVSVIYLSDQIGMTGTQIGIFFLITLIFTLPGSVMGAVITKKTNPSISWRLSMCGLAIVAVIGALTLDKGGVIPSYIWGCFVGVMLGWFYPTENLAFSMLLPRGQEAELSGFYVYCTQILGWLPPLIFSIMVEAGIHQKYGVLTVQAFFVVAIALMSLMAKWPDALEETRPSYSKGDAIVDDDTGEPNEEPTGASANYVTPPDIGGMGVGGIDVGGFEA